MRQFNLDLPGAIDWAAKYHGEVATKFLGGIARLPSWGKAVDDHVAEHVCRTLGNWPRANIAWHFESGRYFGSKGLEYQKTRYVPLLPKKIRTCSSHVRGEDLVVPLVDELMA